MIARVLLADDDALIRRALGTALVRGGFEVHVADDGGPAIALAEAMRPDIVIADLHMTSIGGVEVVHHCKRRFGAGVWCAILSGEDEAFTRDACAPVGVDEVLVKPVRPSALRQRLIDAVRTLRGRAA